MKPLQIGTAFLWTTRIKQNLGGQTNCQQHPTQIAFLQKRLLENAFSVPVTKRRQAKKFNFFAAFSLWIANPLCPPLFQTEFVGLDMNHNMIDQIWTISIIQSGHLLVHRRPVWSNTGAFKTEFSAIYASCLLSGREWRNSKDGPVWLWSSWD